MILWGVVGCVIVFVVVFIYKCFLEENPPLWRPNRSAASDVVVITIL